MNDLVDRLRGLAAAPRGRDRASILGLALTGLWLVLVLVFWLMGPDDAPAAGGLARLLSIAGVILPVALVWMAVGLARAIAELRAEAELLRTRLDMLRAGAAPAEPPIPPAPAGTLAPRAMPARGLRPAEPRAQAPAAAAPVEVAPEVLVAALNFPDGPDDQVAIQALRTALADPETARVIRAAQDVVTLLAKAGLYMDDLPAAPVRAEAWRRLAEGGRGAAVADLAVVSDAGALERAAAMMRDDEVFRDAAQHFLRQYDRTLARVAEDLNDTGIGAMADTRSGRAFTLLAQVAGRFD